MKTFYFTATGNSLYVAKRIGGELCSIPQMLKEEKRDFADDAIGFVFPCYGFGIPKIVSEFVQKSKFTATYCFAIMTYGNTAAAGLQQIEACGGQARLKFNYTNQILMIDNFLPLFEIADQQKKEESKRIEEQLQQIVSDINCRQQKLTRKGLAADAVSKQIHKIGAKVLEQTGDKLFKIADTCNHCRVCEHVCPRGNIKVTEKPEFHHQCESCYACIHHCPQNAIHLKYERSQARFINQNVQLAEIIKANNQSNY